MHSLIAELTTTALGELCAGSAISVGGLIGLFSLRASPEKRGQLFYGKRGRGGPVSKMGIAAIASFILIFGGWLIIAGLTSGNAPRWAIPVLASVFVVLIVVRFVDAIRHRRGKKA